MTELHAPLCKQSNCPNSSQGKCQRRRSSCNRHLAGPPQRGRKPHEPSSQRRVMDQRRLSQLTSFWPRRTCQFLQGNCTLELGSEHGENTLAWYARADQQTHKRLSLQRTTDTHSDAGRSSSRPKDPTVSWIAVALQRGETMSKLRDSVCGSGRAPACSRLVCQLPRPSHGAWLKRRNGLLTRAKRSGQWLPKACENQEGT